MGQAIYARAAEVQRELLGLEPAPEARGCIDLATTLRQAGPPLRLAPAHPSVIIPQAIFR